MRESTVEDCLCTRVKTLGGDVRKVRWIGRVGAPDRLVAVPPARHCLVELKAPGKVPRPSQVREHGRLRELGFEVLVIDTLDLVDQHFPLD